MAEREALTDLWSADEWDAARRTVLNAHYTDPAYVTSMWKAVQSLGVPGDARVLEPGCGTGNFIGAAPVGTRMEGVELDPTTASIARLLNSDATIKNESFAATVLEGDGYDAVIGNVPFAQVKLFDKAYNEGNHSLHNHFIVKSLRLTKPGGVVAVMSSRFTLDSKSDSARREMAKYGELLGAVRMPNGAHKDVAGTDVIIDVLVFRRHDEGTVPDDLLEPSWLRTGTVEGVAGDVAMNSHFLDNPSMILGTAATRNGRFGPELSIPAQQGTNVAAMLEDRLELVALKAKLQNRVWNAAGTVVTDRPVAVTLQDPANVVGRIWSDEVGTLKQNGVEGVTDLKIPKNAVKEMRHLLDIRDAVVTVLDLEAASHLDSPALGSARTDLNRVYDSFVAEFGPLGRSTTTVKERSGKDKHGDPLEPIITRRYPAAIRALRDDPHFATVAALEMFNEDTGIARKATIFTKRVVGAPKPVSQVETAEDAIAVSMDRFGTVDLELIGELLDVPLDEVPTILGDLAYVNPDDPSSYLTDREYLSGDVRAKLRAAEHLTTTDARFLKHVAALTPIIPEPLGPAEIDVKLGAAWVDEEIVSQWITKITGKEVKHISRIDGEYRFETRGKPSDTVEAQWRVVGDVRSMSMTSVMKAVLNGKKLQVTYTEEKGGPTLTDAVATEALQQKAEELHDHFSDWLWKDADRADMLTNRYNDLYNNIALRNYDGVELSLPGKAATFVPHPHQHAAVARMIAEPSVGLFHEVGAGKTAEMVIGVMEMKRLGLVNKPAIIVPNQMLEQFTREFKQIYPRAQVLSAGGSDISVSKGRNGRQMFVARASTGDWDAVIMTHSAFERIGLGDAANVYASEKLAELTEIATEKMADPLAGQSVKNLERALATAEENLKKMLDLEHDEGISFEETGIDYLCIDEAHLYKNLTVHSKVEDLAKADGAKRAQDLEMKLWYLRDHLGQSRVATLATATPLPNSMIEMYVMQKYLRPDLLKAAEVYRADDWARQFTEQVTGVEYKPEGGYQVKTRTVKFRNMPELLRMWHVPGDVKTAADLQLDTPELAVNSAGVRAPEMVVVPPTTEQVEGMTKLVERGQDVRDGKVEPTEDNMLKITSNGRALGLDGRLLGGHGPEADETTKIDVVAGNVAKIWEDTQDLEYLDEWGDVSEQKGAFQIVFADLGTPDPKDNDEYSWTVYDHLRTQLVERGVPRESVRFIHEATDDVKKAKLFQECRDGRVSVLIGSTGKMGVGTNIQNRAIALHHVDAPWRPADVTQREGRLVRQKNQNKEVQIFRYATEGSFDAYMWGTLARKAAFIDQVLSGRLDVREVDNSTEMALQFSEMQAIAAGDMRILEIANLKQDITKLTRNQKAHARKISAIQAQRIRSEQMQSVYVDEAGALKKLLPTVQPTHGDAFTAIMSRRAWDDTPTIQDRKEFGAILRQRIGEGRVNVEGHGFGQWNAAYAKPLNMSVTVGNLEWAAALRYNLLDKTKPFVVFTTATTYKGPELEVPWDSLMGGETSVVSRRFENVVNHMGERIAELDAKGRALKAESAELLAMEKEPWAKQPECDEKKERLAEVVAELEAEARQARDEVPVLDTEVGPVNDAITASRAESTVTQEQSTFVHPSTPPWMRPPSTEPIEPSRYNYDPPASPTLRI